MKTHQTRALTMTVATVLAMALSVSQVQAQANCKWYGATALKQQQQNEQKKCGFSGEFWHSNLADHMAYCNSVPPDVWKKSAQQRDKQLAECGK